MHVHINKVLQLGKEWSEAAIPYSLIHFNRLGQKENGCSLQQTHPK